ncbi:MAG: tyrosine-type recombinase/integrase, partial [Alistipes sp.]|nr:tyrosine-type recombinase/integrase [Alistipes sp.]
IVQIINEWLDSVDVTDVSKRSYRVKLNLWFRWLNNIHYDVRRPTRQQVLDYKRHLEAEGKSSLTVDSYITAVRLFYRYCVRMRYYEDITEGVRYSTKLRGYRKSPLKREDATRLLDSISTDKLIGKRDKLMIAMMLLLGFRTCEIERMNVGDIDVVYDTRVINVQRKGRHDKAEAVALTPYIDELLQDYMSEREVESWDEPLFCSVRGERSRLQRTSISEIVHDRLCSIGINDPHITAHSLRHTCACLLLADGVEMETVRDVLGHTSTNTTRLYVAQMQSQLLIRNSPAKRLESMLMLSNKPND